MSIQHLQLSKKMKALEMSRADVSARALEIAKQMVEHGGYKNAVAGIGRMKVLSMAIKDSYWLEKRMMGEEYEEEYLLHHNTDMKSKAVE